jgi:hypothetical protein
MQVAAAELSIGVLRAIPLREASFERSIGARWVKGARCIRWLPCCWSNWPPDP